MKRKGRRDGVREKMAISRKIKERKRDGSMKETDGRKGRRIKRKRRKL